MFKMMDSFMNWRMFVNEDNLEGNDRLHNKFLDIYVLHPRTHIKEGRALYTDYEVHVKTNHPEFAIKDSSVRRRYSEFVWLKNRLGINDVMMITAPSLPGKRYVGRFKDPFLRKRQLGLQSFMNKVIEINAFLSDPALHLFLQTSLSIDQMESYLQHGVLLSNIRDRVISLQKNRERKEKTKESQDQSRLCNIKICSLKKSLSLDSITSIEKTPDQKDDGGRGWSQYIGDGYCTWEVTTDSDVTDFSAGNNRIRTRSSTATARVLPGGQLQLADETTKLSETLTSTETRIRPASWHGNTSDVIDLMLDGYDIISGVVFDDETSIGVESMSTSFTSKQDNSEYNDGSSDDGIEIDITKRLSEYNIITIPSLQSNETSQDVLHPASENAMHKKISYSENGFHHSFSDSYSS